jgi:hypothetical protein
MQQRIHTKDDVLCVVTHTVRAAIHSQGLAQHGQGETYSRGNSRRGTFVLKEIKKSVKRFPLHAFFYFKF